MSYELNSMLLVETTKLLDVAIAINKCMRPLLSPSRLYAPISPLEFQILFAPQPFVFHLQPYGKVHP